MSSEMREVEVLLNKWLVRYNELIQMDRTNEAEQVLRCINEGKRTLLARTEAGADGVVEPNGPEFTDWARAALSWVLYHHQGGSSPVGQPIRFALGMGANERLPDWRIADGKRWAAQTGSTTADFHTHPQDASGDAERYRWLRTALYSQNLDIGEAELSLRCYGAAPTLEQFDAAIDAAMQAKEAK